MAHLYTVWGDAREPLLSGVDWETATEYVKGSTYLKDLYIQNDMTADCFVYNEDTDKFEEE